MKITPELAFLFVRIGGNALMVFDIRTPLVKIDDMVENVNIILDLDCTPPGRNCGNALGTPS